MIGHRARFRENDDLPLLRGPAAKKKPPFFNAPALITGKIMRSRGVSNGPIQFKGARKIWSLLELLAKIG